MFKWTTLICAASLALALSGDAERATADVRCASEGQGCRIADNGVALLTYGSRQSFGLMAENQESIGCGNGTFGDPEFGQGKNCSYEIVKGFSDRSFTKCAAEGGGLCKAGVSAGQVKLARFGTPNGQRWLYAYVGGDFDCKNKGLGSDLDPAPGIVKECQVAQETEATLSGTWSTCAAEGQGCTFPDSGPRFVRYGDKRTSRFLYKTFMGTKLDCNNQTFPHDPAFGVTKFCDVLKTKPGALIQSVRGQWSKIVRCKNCSNTSYTVSVGVSEGTEKTKSEEWSKALTVTVEQSGGVDLEVVNTETKVSVASTVSHSTAESISKSFTQELSTSKTVECDKGGLWQWVTTVQELCPAGLCSTKANADEFECQATMPTSLPD